MGAHDLNFRLGICDPSGFKRPGVTHERGQDAVWSRSMPWKTSGSSTATAAIRECAPWLDCTDLFRVMTFSQLTWRESLRDIQAAVKRHTLPDLRGAIPAFIHISDGKMGDVNVLDILPVEAGISADSSSCIRRERSLSPVPNAAATPAMFTRL